MEHNFPNSIVANKYCCQVCDYGTSHKSNYEKHLNSKKHDGIINGSKSSKQRIKHICNICSKKYSTQSGLWKHKQKCIEIVADIVNIKKHITPTTEMFYELLKQNNEFKDLIVEQNKQIIELSSKPTTTNNNRKFNLNSFLNETCKDALNINDFVKNLQITEKDVDETNKIGYVNGITKIFINALEKLEINQRPVHCSDTKRESVYIRHDNKWEKENYLNIKLIYAIGHIVKLLRNADTQRNELLEKQGIRTNLFPEPRIDVSEVTKPIGMEYTTPKESSKNYDRISRNIMRETNIPK
jgi:hypothetical protein